MITHTRRINVPWPARLEASNDFGLSICIYASRHGRVSSPNYKQRPHPLLLGNLDRTVIDTLDNVVRVLPVDGASDGLGGSENLLDGTSEVLGERLVLHLSGDLREEWNEDVKPSMSHLILTRCVLLPWLRLLTETISSKETLPVCLMFFSFFRSLGGSFKALMTKLEALGTTLTLA